MTWLEAQKMAHASHQEVFVDYLNEVKRAKERVGRLEKSIDAAIARASKHLQELIGALQGLRGVAKIGAATLVTEIVRSPYGTSFCHGSRSCVHHFTTDGVRSHGR